MSDSRAVSSKGKAIMIIDHPLVVTAQMEDQGMCTEL